MCGVVGLIDPAKSAPERENQALQMLSTLHHRGPDAVGVQSAGAATLGTARLAIVDIAHGTQPIVSDRPDGRLRLLAYNGEVYNHQTLRAELQLRGVQFHSHSDTEVVLAAHAVWGRDAVTRLDGMFAYALWNEDLGELTLVRDRLGIKPLYWMRHGEGLAFASEPRALLMLQGGRGRADVLGLAEIFAMGAGFPAGCAVGERTVYAGIAALPAATMLVWRDGQVTQRRWWTPQELLNLQPFSTPDEAGEALEAAFVDAVRATRMGDVEVGAALSGGLDSSLLTAELLAQSPGRVVAATITYRSDHGDADAVAARNVSDHLRILHGDRLDHRWTQLDQGAWLGGIDALVDAFGEPCWEPRKLGMMANYRTLREAGCKVALSGEGADELFFGYYPRFAGWRDPPPPMHTVGDFAQAWQRKRAETLQLFAPAVQSGLVDAAALDAIADDTLDQWLRPYWRDTSDRVRAVQLWYMHTFLHWLLADNDRFGMAWSIEARFPFLVNGMLDVALRMDPTWNFPGADGLPDKALERRLGPTRLPASVWQQRVKAPMPTPADLTWHLALADTLQAEMTQAPRAVWQVLNQAYLTNQIGQFRATVGPLLATDPWGGEAVSKYNPRLPVRTVHLFGALTTLRWWSRHVCDVAA